MFGMGTGVASSLEPPERLKALTKLFLPWILRAEISRGEL